jgi:hypothetical protein
MKTAFRWHFLCSTAAPAVLLAALLAANAHAVRIDGMERLKGLSPVAPVLAVATPSVRAGKLELPLPEHGNLSISPWPAYLPQRFDTQRIGISRQLHPAGPIDRISLTRGAEGQSWLEVVHGARSASNVVGDWQLQRTERGWSLAGRTTEHWLGSGAQAGTPVSVPVGDARWCVYLLESRVPQRHPNVAYEEEPQADWVAIRLESGRKRCPVR